MASQIRFHDPDCVKAALSKDGFAVVPNLFAPQDIREVEQILDGLSAELQSLALGDQRRRFAGDMLPSSMAADHKNPSRPDQFEIKYAASLDPRLLKTRLFSRCEAFARAIGGNVSRCFDHAIIKSDRNRSETPWHQDAAFFESGAMPLAVRQSRLHIWIPLQDASIDNGCMEFIAGSHREPLLHHERFSRKSGGSGYFTELVDERRRVACPVPAGGVTVHMPHTLHYCGRNTTDKPRKAWIIQFSRFGAARLALKSLAGRIPGRLL